MRYGEAALYLGPELQALQRRATDEINERVSATFRLVCGSDATTHYRELEGDRRQLLAVAARTADLVVLGKGSSDSHETQLVVEHLALAAGVPVLMLPSTIPDQIGQTVVVGWNDSREATRAAHDALPFLATARRVVLCAVGEEAAAHVDDAASMLLRHGLESRPQVVKITEGSAGRVLCEQAQNFNADLLVMGAYGHAKLREVVFGGATRHVLMNTPVPVLFSA
jgi:nucleotide-binding universal stress UspA family protein